MRRILITYSTTEMEHCGACGSIRGSVRCSDCVCIEIASAADRRYDAANAFMRERDLLSVELQAHVRMQNSQRDYVASLAKQKALLKEGVVLDTKLNEYRQTRDTLRKFIEKVHSVKQSSEKDRMAHTPYSTSSVVDNGSLVQRQSYHIEKILELLRVFRSGHNSCSILGIEVADDFDVAALAPQTLGIVLGTMAVLVCTLSRYMNVPLLIHIGWESMARVYVVDRPDSGRWPHNAVRTDREYGQRYNLYIDPLAPGSFEEVRTGVRFLSHAVSRLCRRSGINGTILESRPLANLLELNARMCGQGVVSKEASDASEKTDILCGSASGLVNALSGMVEDYY